MNPSFTAQRRVTECPASAALPQARSTSAASKKGTENHKAVELAITTGNFENLSPKLAAFLAGCTDCECEVAYAIDVERQKVRRIGVGIDRNYGPLDPYEIPGTVDLVCRIGGRLWVIDFKSRQRVEDAATNPQIIAGVVAAMAEFGDEEASGGIWYLNDDWFDRDGAEFTAIDVAGYYADRMAMFLEAATALNDYEEGGVPEVHTGPWCQYCPAMHHCPAKTRLALASTGILVDIKQRISGMTNEEAGRAWDKLDEIKSLAKQIEESLKERAMVEPLPVDDGKKLLTYVEQAFTGYAVKPGIKMVPRKLKIVA